MNSLTPNQVRDSYAWLLQLGGSEVNNARVLTGDGVPTPFNILDTNTLSISSLDTNQITTSLPYNYQSVGAIAACNGFIGIRIASTSCLQPLTASNGVVYTTGSLCAIDNSCMLGDATQYSDSAFLMSCRKVHACAPFYRSVYFKNEACDLASSQKVNFINSVALKSTTTTNTVNWTNSIGKQGDNVLNSFDYPFNNSTTYGCVSSGFLSTKSCRGFMSDNTNDSFSIFNRTCGIDTVQRSSFIRTDACCNYASPNTVDSVRINRGAAATTVNSINSSLFVNVVCLPNSCPMENHASSVLAAASQESINSTHTAPAAGYIRNSFNIGAACTVMGASSGVNNIHAFNAITLPTKTTPYRNVVTIGYTSCPSLLQSYNDNEVIVGVCNMVSIEDTTIGGYIRLAACNRSLTTNRNNYSNGNFCGCNSFCSHTATSLSLSSNSCNVALLGDNTSTAGYGCVINSSIDTAGNCTYCNICNSLLLKTPPITTLSAINATALGSTCAPLYKNASYFYRLAPQLPTSPTGLPCGHLWRCTADNTMRIVLS